MWRYELTRWWYYWRNPPDFKKCEEMFIGALRWHVNSYERKYQFWSGAHANAWMFTMSQRANSDCKFWANKLMKYPEPPEGYIPRVSANYPGYREYN
jgi:hypothetical protein